MNFANTKSGSMNVLQQQKIKKKHLIIEIHDVTVVCDMLVGQNS